MLLAIHTDELLKQELINNGVEHNLNLVTVTNAEEFRRQTDADAFLDLLFDSSPGRIELLRALLPKPVVVNSVVTTLAQMNAPFVRINAWPGFLKRQVVEASCTDERIRQDVNQIFSLLNKQIQWINDKPGFVTPLIVASIINEAWFALQEGISTKEEIDIAMKLGTSYPFGPFEWCENIGITDVHALLSELTLMNPRYKPAALLEKEASRHGADLKY